MTEIVMPRLSDSMSEGTVVRWLKAPGDAIRRGEPIAEIETDKATITYESYLDGVLAEMIVAEGETVAVGAPIARVESSEQAAPPVAAEESAPESPEVEQSRQAPVAGSAGSGERMKISPVARRLAAKLGVDTSGIVGSGPGGRVVKDDVAAAAQASAEREQQAAAEPVAEQAPAGATGETTVAQPPGGEPDGGAAPGEEVPLLLPLEEQQILPPQTQTQAPPQPPQPQPPAQPQAPQPQPPAQPQPQPGFAQQPQAPGFYPPQQPGWAPPYPAPPYQGAPGTFPPPPPQMPQPPSFAPPQAPPPEQAQPPGTETTTRGYSTRVEPSNAQQTVARRMAESKATAPDFFVEVEVDMTACVAYREQLRSAVTPLPSFNDFVVSASARALRQHPVVNAAYKDGRFERYSDVNVGIVVSAGELLAVPTLFNADQKGLSQIAAEAQQLAEAVRSRSIQPAQMSGGTFSISNLGMFGVDRFTAIINPPQAAILAVGAINRRPVIAEDGVSLVIRQIMTITLSCDHRVLYGAPAAEFLGAVKAWLESPQLLPV